MTPEQQYLEAYAIRCKIEEEMRELALSLTMALEREKLCKLKLTHEVDPASYFAKMSSATVPS